MQLEKLITLSEAVASSNKKNTDLIYRYKSDGVIYYPLFDVLGLARVIRYGFIPTDVGFVRLGERELKELTWKEEIIVKELISGDKPFLSRDGEQFGGMYMGEVWEKSAVYIENGLKVERAKLVINRDVFSGVVNDVSLVKPKVIKGNPETLERWILWELKENGDTLEGGFSYGFQSRMIKQSEIYGFTDDKTVKRAFSKLGLISAARIKNTQ